jgi:glycosyltransferase involved in cell wall biosynthesis
LNIAILAPSPVPFTLGGLEYLAQGIQRYVNEQTGHKAELFKLPTIEKDFWTLIESYYQFFKLDLSHFDACLSMKYPTWMVNHDHHILYMAHPLRGLYDTYHFSGQPINPGKVTTKTDTLLRSVEKIRTREDVEEVFGLCFELQQLAENSKDIQREFIFPGSVARTVIHRLDAWAFSNMTKFGSISRTVRLREGYFPSEVDVKTIYPPSSLDNLHLGEDQGYFLSVSRLDNAKRVDLIIRAMQQIEGGILFVVGSGPEENHLKEIAKGNERIKFLGRVSDSELESLYANCKAVVYAPYDEDYGLVTVEAFMSGKPVITCTDSGGVTELVSEYENGFIAMPTPESLAEKMSIALRENDLMVRLGRQGKRIADEIRWDNVIHWIFSEPSSHIENRKNNLVQKKTVVLSTFEVYPPKNGGQIRSYQLYSGFAALGEVTIISLGREGNTREKIIGEHVKEIVIGRSERHIREEYLIEKEVGTPVTDIVAASLMKFTPEFNKQLIRELDKADIVVLSHPYLVELIPHNKDFKIIFDAHNVEIDLKHTVLGDGKNTSELLEKISIIEAEAVRRADEILICSHEDKLRLSALYGDIVDKALIVPNGVDTEKIKFIDQKQRKIVKDGVGLKGIICLFMGSWHQPNIEAVKRIFNIANSMPGIHFFVAGSVAMAVKNIPHSQNVGLLEDFDDATKKLLLSVSDVAIHPMDNGSGTNLKIFEYMAAGLPIVSTNHGVRGLPAEMKKNIFMAESNEQFTLKIKEISSLNEEQLRNNLNPLRINVETEFSWGVIVKQAINFIKKL